MKKLDRWFAFYGDSYLGATLHLTTQQHGAYLLLLLAYWKSGPLPDDDDTLASIAKMDPAAWPAVRRALIGPALFTLAGDGLLRQAKMEKEIDRAASLSAKRADAGRGGAEARYGGQRAEPAPLVRKESLHTQEPPALELAGGTAKAKRATGDAAFDAFWAAYPKKVGKIEAQKQFAAALKGGATLEKIMAALATYKPDPQYTLDPERWLKKGRWLDEATAGKGAAARTRRPDEPNPANPVNRKTGVHFSDAEMMDMAAEGGS
jgi:uncharacterized protein YdaU (DUF1376 family)